MVIPLKFRAIFEKTSFLFLILALLWLPIFKAGMMPGAFSWLIINALLILVFAAVAFEADSKTVAWMLVWSVFTLTIVSHVWLLPNFFGFERFFSSGSELGELSSLNGKAVDMYGAMHVWAFFSVMWIVAWRVSLLNLKQVGLLLSVMLLVSLFQAVYGLYGFITSNDSILGLWTKEFYLRDATGTFVNRNHFGGMLAMAWPLVLAGLVSSKALILPFLSRAYRIAIASFYSIIVLLALISSHSRMSMAAAMFGVIVCLYLILQNSYLAKVKKIPVIWQVCAILLPLLLFSLWFGLGDIAQRYADLEDGNSRFDVWRAMFSVPFNVWLFGVGPGAFEDVFQLVKPSYFSVRFVYAHNDYLEFLFEFGLLASIVLLLVIIYWAKKVYSLGNSTLDLTLKAGTYSTIVVISLHSLVDFNLQIPASAFIAWLALGLLMNGEMRSEPIDEVKNDKKSVSKSHSKNKFENKTRRRVKKKLPRSKREWIAFLGPD